MITKLNCYQDKIISSGFYNHPPTDVAKQMLGKYLVRVIADDLLAGKIVETEAYLPFGDTAAHNVAKKQSLKTRSLWQTAGHAYVHKMRQYCLLDVVTQGVDQPGSVLIRAVEPVDGIEFMKTNRRTDKLLNLCSGPGKLCQAFVITHEFDGIDMTKKDSLLFISNLDASLPPDSIMASTRVGISKAKDKMLRFMVKDNPFVS